MELSVSFTDEKQAIERELGATHIELQSSIGKVYVPKEGVEITGPIGIRYERHPWIEQFEVDGIRAVRPKRTGYGTKNFEAFVKSLSTIYNKAYDLYREIEENAENKHVKYFAQVTDDFIEMSRDANKTKICNKFCGFVENLWREGNNEVCNIALNTIIPRLKNDKLMNERFRQNITDEFREYLGLQ